MIYVASPYHDSNPGLMHERYRAVCIFCASMINEGKFVFSPIAHWHPIAVTHSLPKDADWWRKLDEDYLRHSSELWVLKLVGWRESKGVRREISFAWDNGIRVSYYEEGGTKECMKS